MIDAADERIEEPEPEVQKVAESKPEEKKAPAPAPVDNFHKDPLIQDALEIFKGKLRN